jgi:hypothetical protein
MFLPFCTHASHDIYISGGINISKLNNFADVQINDSMLNTFNTQQTTQTNPYGSFGVGHSFSYIGSIPLKFMVAVSAYLSSFGAIKGIEHPFANDGDYDTLNYQFSARSVGLILETRWFYNNSQHWQPFLLLGAGSAWNHLYNYNETPTDPALSASSALQFSNHTTSAFAYEIGLGIEHPLFITVKDKIHYTAALDWRYLNFGKSQLGPFPAQTSQDRLHITSLQTQAILITLKASWLN